MTLALHIEILPGADLTTVAADAIVNAANTQLLLGAGVAGAIRVRGGPTIQAECDLLAPIPLGGAAVTSAGNLPCTRHVIHAATMHAGGQATADSVHRATSHALQQAEKIRAASVAFPALGMGIGGLAINDGAAAMLSAIRAHRGMHLRRVLLALSPEIAEAFRLRLQAD